ncbi:hypothetical protein [Photorhabdus namnaonensis]|uniref:Cwf19-like C-terminal domain-containing protein n=1 Tax=Photorhabdus namnaonensis TaxID=1851568 RepID=A0A1B8YK66_9GAMM|nr:hypothetical protein [Photorhabdus namnaonensis]OCA55560.1 hypothetical protein Phpb_01393 [Photorhabdus namnaonensis]
MGCIFCHPESSFEKDKILLRGKYFYVFVPKGQIIEGYIIIATNKCETDAGGYRCFAEIYDEEAIKELKEFKNIINDFYREYYNISNPLCYENGRAGGCIIMDPNQKYCYHAHLCCFPTEIDLHNRLKDQFKMHIIDSLDELKMFGETGPYIYVEDSGNKYVFTIGESDFIERGMIRTVLAKNLNVPERSDWRDNEGIKEMDATAKKFKLYINDHMEIEECYMQM